MILIAATGFIYNKHLFAASCLFIAAIIAIAAAICLHIRHVTRKRRTIAWGIVISFVVIHVTSLVTASVVFQSPYSEQTKNKPVTNYDHAEQRPWISVSQFFPGGPLTTDVNGINIKIGYVVHNTGHSPASGILANAVPSVLIPMKGFTNQTDDRVICKQAEVGINGFTVFQGEGMALQTEVSIPLSDIANAIVYKKTGKKILPIFIHFCIGYRSPGETSFHHTSYVLRLAELNDGIWGTVEYDGSAISGSNLRFIIYPVTNVSAD